MRPAARILAHTLFRANAAVGALLGLAVETRASADEAARFADTTYGRVTGDLAITLGVGATFSGGLGVRSAPRDESIEGDPSAPRGTLDIRLRYLETAGLFGAFEDCFSSTASNPRRILSTGLELRPLFLARWLGGHEFGIPWLDLFLDSFGLEVGAFYEEPVGEAFGNRPGLQAGLGLEIPILPAASGPWIGVHGGLRWSDATLQEDSAAATPDRSAFFTVTLAYHQLLAAHVVDARDVSPR
jgi:hypothetical protein